MRNARVVVAATVAILCAGAVAASAASAALWNYTTRGAYSFVSSPKLHPPKLHWKVKGHAKLASGYFFIANTPNLAAGTKMAGQSGPEILDNHGHPVWFQPVARNVVANDLTLQTYNGQPALSYWQGVENAEGVITKGEDVVLDQHYHKIATLKGKKGWIIDLHEMAISGTDAWVIASKSQKADLRPEHGPRHGTFVDNAVQEYDLTKGKLLYTWDAKQRVKSSDTYSRPNKRGIWDPYHMNSLQLTGSSTFLVSMRNTWAAYMVDQSTNHIDWTLGGKRSTFKIAGKAQFQWQHDVQLHPNNVVSMFDDHCCQVDKNGNLVVPNRSTRGLVLRLNMGSHRVSEVAQYTRGKHFYTAFLGDTELLGNGNVVVGWGSQPFFSEFSHSGKMLLDVEFPGPDLSYRAELEHWVGMPSSPPVGAVKTKSGRATVYASWNGATQVAKWRVMAGSSSSHLSAVATTGNTGFETAIALRKKYSAYEVVALDSKGNTLGTSKPFPRGHFGHY